MQVLRKRLVPSPVLIEHAEPEPEPDGGGDVEGTPISFYDAGMARATYGV